MVYLVRGAGCSDSDTLACPAGEEVMMLGSAGLQEHSVRGAFESFPHLPESAMRVARTISASKSPSQWPSLFEQGSTTSGWPGPSNRINAQAFRFSHRETITRKSFTLKVIEVSYADGGGEDVRRGHGSISQPGPMGREWPT